MPQYASTCHPCPKLHPFSILHFFLRSFSLQNRHGIWTCSWATSLPQSLPRKVWMHMGPATKRARFVRPEATELIWMCRFGGLWRFSSKVKNEDFFSKVALKVSCLKVLDVFFASTLLRWKLLLACEQQTTCSSRKQRINGWTMLEEKYTKHRPIGEAKGNPLKLAYEKPSIYRPATPKQCSSLTGLSLSH